MMGANHAITGAAAWVALTASAPIVTSGIMPMGAVGVFVGAIVCAGAALLPDADHHNGTIAHSVPVVGSVITGTIGQMAGGHRQGLHSALAVLGILAISIGLGFIQMPTEFFGVLPLGAGVATVALVAFAAKALKITRGSWVLPWLVGLAVAAGIVFFAPTEILWLPVAITLGFVVHLAGDMLTVGGVPVLWPLKPKPPLAWQATPVLNSIWQKNGYFALPILGKTGSIREWLLGVLVSTYVFCVLVFEGFWAIGINIVDLLV